ncbi:MAG: hypothetical protein FWD88_06775 [Treponema sp.]|nr:hypothetical protein [Treponema sp.]
MSKNLFLAISIAILLALPCFVLAQTPSSPAEELRSAIARAEEYRQNAGNFEAASYFPSEWVVAEALYAEARLLPTGSASETNRAITAFTSVADSFAAMFRLTVSLYAQAREDEIMIIRGGLIAGGARAVFPELMGPADQAALTALDLYEVGDYRSARDYATKAHIMFQILETSFSAWQMRQEIVRMGFMDYAMDNYERAEEVISEAMQAYIVGEFPAALENAMEAQARYTLVLSSGWAVLAEYHSTLAKAERTAAVEARANVAAREVFEEADFLYYTAVVSVRREYYREAAELFAGAEALYLVARTSTLERRRIAAEAIREANRQIEETIRAAQQAELDSN